MSPERVVRRSTGLVKAVRTSDGVITRKNARERTKVIDRWPNESNPLNRVTRNAWNEQLKGMEEDWTHYVMCPIGSPKMWGECFLNRS